MPSDRVRGAPRSPVERADVAIVGAGAAGLAAAIFAGRAAARGGSRPRLVVLDGATRIGAKILVSGGGRCNVTHDVVDEKAFSGSTPPAIRKVLRRLEVDDTIAFFAEIGVDLVREPTGKLFPASGSARTVLEALLRAARGAGAELLHPWRVERVEPVDRGGAGFAILGPSGRLLADRFVLATGGCSLPRTGSDGAGYGMAARLGHSLTPAILPALVPLVLAEDSFVRGLSGVSAPARVEVRSGSGRTLFRCEGAVLCTHFGLSGPAILDASRHWLAARLDDPSSTLFLDWLAHLGAAERNAALPAQGRMSPGRWLRTAGLPQRLAEGLCAHAGVDPSVPIAGLARDARRNLHVAATGLRVPVTRDRGFTHAEVTAGGVPLRELRLETMESRVRPGLHLAGEICDVDGRIGGYNFQWAWASGRVAGEGAIAGRSA